jgi:hypothetical protein
MDKHKLYRIRVEGDDIAIVSGYLTDKEVETLTERCRRSQVELTLEPLELPVGLDAVMDEQDWNTAQDIRSLTND